MARINQNSKIEKIKYLFVDAKFEYQLPKDTFLNENLYTVTLDDKTINDFSWITFDSKIKTFTVKKKDSINKSFGC